MLVKDVKKRIEPNRYFPEVFDELDPSRNYPLTKQLPDPQKELLEEALTAYSNSH